MFCEEIITNVYLGQPKWHGSGDCFLDYYCDMALHITPDYRLIFETDDYFVSVQSDGLFKLDKSGGLDSIVKDDEWIESYYDAADDPEDAPWVDYEHTLFVGERIIGTENCKRGYFIQFTDFKLQVIPYVKGDHIRGFIPAVYSKLLGTERLIKKCSCGGNGILEIDFVNDYGIRCDRCHMGTCATMCAIDAIDEWNSGTDLIQIGDYPAESFQKHCFGKISYIAIAERFHNIDKNTIECSGIILDIDDMFFKIRGCYIGGGRFGFSFEQFTSYNPQMWPQKIISTDETPLRFVEKKTDGDHMLCFEHGGKPLCITAGADVLTIVNGYVENRIV